MENKYILADGRTAGTLKEVRQLLSCSGRAIKHLFNAGVIRKIESNNVNVNNDARTNNN